MKRFVIRRELNMPTITMKTKTNKTYDEKMKEFNEFY